ncbi:28275_t:CDS:2, partial [Racocetra persica]
TLIIIELKQSIETLYQPSSSLKGASSTKSAESSSPTTGSFGKDLYNIEFTTACEAKSATCHITRYEGVKSILQTLLARKAVSMATARSV